MEAGASSSPIGAQAETWQMLEKRLQSRGFGLRLGWADYAETFRIISIWVAKATQINCFL